MRMYFSENHQLQMNSFHILANHINHEGNVDRAAFYSAMLATS